MPNKQSLCNTQPISPAEAELIFVAIVSPSWQSGCNAFQGKQT